MRFRVHYDDHIRTYFDVTDIEQFVARMSADKKVVSYHRIAQQPAVVGAGPENTHSARSVLQARPTL